MKVVVYKELYGSHIECAMLHKHKFRFTPLSKKVCIVHAYCKKLDCFWMAPLVRIAKKKEKAK